MELITARLLLREFCHSDLDDLVAYTFLPEMRHYERGMPDLDSTHRFLKRTIQTAAEIPRIYYCLAITVPPANRVIGHISLSSQNSLIREWEIGWAIRSLDWQKGYASEAAQRMLGYAFDQMDAHRIVAFCHADNKASIKVMEKIGMQQEGHLRQTRWFNDGWADELVYAILDTDLAK